MWFHVTKNYLGKEIILKPHAPESDCIRNTEGDIPRICVSDDIFLCLRGIIGNPVPTSLHFKDHFVENPSVYCTEEKAFLPPNCSDFRENHEHWILKPTKFFFLAYLDIRALLLRNMIIPTGKKELIYPKREKYIKDSPKVDFVRRIIR